eukprot:TRINITY_DN4824_c4_g1_i1.p1 TRINITY_DN4824_c4_g1~~TRINITY_DN4824_c4_g1_i1.p1  ORF type:complete len:815 (+),score=196.20 TRINITY_DN4824_c4_g1_i1:60-2504(+)
MGSACAVNRQPRLVCDHRGCEGREMTGEPDYFQLRIISAEGLRGVECPFSEDLSCDPYVVVRDALGNEMGRTTTVFRSQNPEWDFWLSLHCIASSKKTFTLHLWDYNTLADTRLGMCTINLEDLAKNEDMEHTLSLQSDEGSAAQGTITLSVRNFVPEPDNGAWDSLHLLVGRGYHMPGSKIMGDAKTYVKVEVLERGIVRKSRVCGRARHPVWNSVVDLPDAQDWDVETTQVRFSVYDTDLVRDDLIGDAVVDLSDLLKRFSMRLLISDKNGDAVLSSQPPHMACLIDVAVIESSIPASWPRPSRREYKQYPQHVVMITRGTRGDVQPFVALARGLATELGWMVTIVTELRWKGFVKKNSNVERGCIRFRPSGGDTEKRVNTAVAQWAMSRTGELLQSIMLGWSEAEFFGSGPVFMGHMCEMRRSTNPATLIVFGFTTAGIGLLASERCNIPCVGFILQPTSIPSVEPSWRAVLPITGFDPLLTVSNGSNTSDSSSSQSQQQSGSSEPSIPERRFTGHKTLKRIKSFAETNVFATHSLPAMRRSFGLRPLDTWPTIQQLDIPLLIPMSPGTFERPADWGPRTKLTDFIFLRNGKTPGSGQLKEPLKSFVDKAQADKVPLVVMTFSSMPVRRATMLECAVKMVTECKHPLRLVYIGKRQQDKVGARLLSRAEELMKEDRFIELEAADFGVLFPLADAFVVHGGLGTTVEALRTGNPVAVTGPLIMDQRFWGSVCYRKGVGPPPVHINEFAKTCVDFCDGALSPDDVYGWRLQARMHQWGELQDDGVAVNAQAFKCLVCDGLNPVTLTVTDLTTP